MSILDQAIQFEYEGHKFFSEKAAQAQNPGVKQILTNLAEDELEHAEYLKGLKSGLRDELKPSDAMKNIKKILEESTLTNARFLAEEVGIMDVLNAALELEERAHQHYTAEALAELDDNTRKLLEKLAIVEEGHHKLIQSLIDFLDNPQSILETQEFQMY